MQNNMDNKPKVLLYHPMQQHSYKTAEGLIKYGMLCQYWTSIYYNPDRLIYKILGIVLGKNNKKRMMGRNNSQLTPYVHTCAELWGLLFLLFGRIDKSNRLTQFFKNVLIQISGKKVAKVSIKEDVDIIIAYDTWAYAVIKELKRRKSGIKVVVDYSSLYAEEIKNIIESDVDKKPESSRSYKYTLKKFTKRNMNYYRYEMNNADYYLSPSSVVDLSLTKYGANINRIFRCTYGSYFDIQPYKKKNTEKVTFVYIGRMSYAKGVHYLLKAFQALDREDFELLLIGADTDHLVTGISSKQIKYIGMIQHNEIPTYLKRSDVVISASLYDGFSLALLEAAAYNLPIICTNKTGASDYIVDGVNGFVIPSQDEKVITETVLYILNHKDTVNEMNKHVSCIVSKLTWDNYYQNVATAIDCIIAER